jgi:hypothetical protein
VIKLSSRAVKLSSWVAVELTAVVVVVAAAVELTTVVVVVTQVTAVAVAMTQIAIVAVASLNWKISGLPCQTQCPACAVGRDSQHSL